MMDMKVCENCGYRRSRKNCCMDIYQRLGQTKGPSIVGKVLLAFVLPLLVFIGSLVLAGYLLSIFINESRMSALYAFLIAAVLTIVFVQLIRILTRKPIDAENKK
jgi:uncharacterized membrane protein